MKTEKLNAERLWKQFEDDLIPQLRLSVIDRAVYSHLLRHSRLEGKPRVRFSLAWLAHGARLCVGSARPALHRLFDNGALRLIECSKNGHLVQVRLPEEIRGVRMSEIVEPPRKARAANIEGTDFLQSGRLRRAIHAREAGRCLYCLRRVVRRRRPRRNGCYQKQSADIERQGKEGNVSGCRRKSWDVDGDALQQGRGEFSQPTTFGGIQTCNNQVLKDEGRAKKDYETSQQPARVEDRKLTGPERPEKKEREHPMQQTVVRQN